MLLVIKKNKEQGFSIMEVMVVITIVLIGLIGLLSLTIQNVRAQNINKNALMASQLAQEGIELVRNVRDTNWLNSGNNWKTGSSTNSNTDIIQDGDYMIDIDFDSSSNDILITDIDNIDSARLNIRADGFYWHGAGSPSPFFRLISVTDNGNYVVVTCKVLWRTGTGDHNFVAETLLYDWR